MTHAAQTLPLLITETAIVEVVYNRYGLIGPTATFREMAIQDIQDAVRAERDRAPREFRWTPEVHGVLLTAWIPPVGEGKVVVQVNQDYQRTTKH